jgi:uncharacterized phage-like protein YoqJ
MIIGATGHRPQVIGGNYPQVIARMHKIAYKYLSEKKPDKVVVGMALGWDTCVATMACQLRIPFIAAIPFVGQESRWSDSQKEIYTYLLERAERVIIAADKFSNSAYKKRNILIVDESTELMALFNGDTRSGTAHCINYANFKGIPVTNLYQEYTRIPE